MVFKEEALETVNPQPFLFLVLGLGVGVGWGWNGEPGVRFRDLGVGHPCLPSPTLCSPGAGACAWEWSDQTP